MDSAVYFSKRNINYFISHLCPIGWTILINKHVGSPFCSHTCQSSGIWDKYMEEFPCQFSTRIHFNMVTIICICELFSAHEMLSQLQVIEMLECNVSKPYSNVLFTKFTHCICDYKCKGYTNSFIKLVQCVTLRTTHKQMTKKLTMTQHKTHLQLQLCIKSIAVNNFKVCTMVAYRASFG